MNPRAHLRAHAPFARLVHVLLLLGWLLSTNGVVPAVVAVAAALDGSHAVKVITASGGEVSVVLVHDDQVIETASRDHDVLTALLVALAREPAQEDADHVICFKSVQDASRSVRRQVTHEIHIKCPVRNVTERTGEWPVPFASEPAGALLREKAPWHVAGVMSARLRPMRC